MKNKIWQFFTGIMAALLVCSTALSIVNPYIIFDPTCAGRVDIDEQKKLGYSHLRYLSAEQLENLREGINQRLYQKRECPHNRELFDWRYPPGSSLRTVDNESGSEYQIHMADTTGEGHLTFPVTDGDIMTSDHEDKTWVGFFKLIRKRVTISGSSAEAIFKGAPSQGLQILDKGSLNFQRTGITKLKILPGMTCVHRTEAASPYECVSVQMVRLSQLRGVPSDFFDLRDGPHPRPAFRGGN